MRQDLALKRSSPVHPLCLSAVLVLLTGLCCSGAVQAGTTWIEPFEAYAAGTFPSPPWVSSGNTDVQVDNQVHFAGQSSLRLFGLVGSCWGALAHRVLNTLPPYEIEFLVRNGSETLSGCHPDHGGVQLNTGPSWTTPGRGLIRFNKQGEIRSYEGGDQNKGILLGTYLPNIWYRVKIRYARVGTETIRLSFWINDQLRGSQDLGVRWSESEGNFTYLAITSNEGTAWFDDVKVTHLDTLNPEVLGVTPNRGGNIGQVTVTIATSGIDLNQPPMVKLKKAGESEIVGQGISVNGDSVAARFDLAGRSLGSRDLVVIDATGREFNLPGAFTVEEGVAPQLWVDIVGRGAIRSGRPETFWIVHGNRGNIDAQFGQIILTFPKQISAKVDTPRALYVTPGSLPPGYALPNAVVSVRLKDVAAGSTSAFPLVLTAPAGTNDLRIGGLILQPEDISSAHQSLLSGKASIQPVEIIGQIWSSDDPNDLTYHAILVLPVKDPDGAIRWYAYTQREVQDGVDILRRYPADQLAQIMPPHLYPSTGTYSVDQSQLDSLVQGLEYFRDRTLWVHDEDSWKQVFTQGRGNCVGVLEALAEQAGINGGKGFIEREWRIYDEIEFAKAFDFDRDLPPYQPKERRHMIAQLLGKLPDEWREFDAQIVGSYDPNEKLGSLGHGQDSFVSGKEPLRYTIAFENLESATAPAQEIAIADLLDTTKVDISTLSLGQVSFGAQRLSPPLGTRAIATTVDLRPAQNLAVRIEASADINSGLLTWRFTSIDPATGGLPEDPLAGFLPPNISPPEGEGSVFFTVMPKDNLPTGTEIGNRATITFDTNPPIETQEWVNTLDNTKPSSQVLPLGSVRSELDFEVEWSGTDVGSGIRSYDLWVSEDSGPFSPWLTGTAETAATFHGVSGRTYSFYSIARDWTDNLEEAPAVPDSATQVAILPPIVQSISPNSGPTEGGTAVTISGSGFAAGATVQIGGVAPTDLDIESPTTITARTVPHATGAVDVTVTNPDGLGATLSRSFFFYSPPPGGFDFFTLTPCRVVDTRWAQGPMGGPALAASQERLFTAAGACGIPPAAKALAVNVTVVSPTGSGYLSLFPGNAFFLGTSATNFSPWQNRASSAIVLLATDGTGSLGILNASGGSVHLVLDVYGYFE